MDELPPPRLPDPPPGIDGQRWRDALEAVACFQARGARQLAPDGFLPDMTPYAKELAERLAARWRALLVQPGDPLPWFFSEDAPVFPHDPEAIALLGAVGVLSLGGYGPKSQAGDGEAIMQLIRRAQERASR